MAEVHCNLKKVTILSSKYQIGNGVFFGTAGLRTVQFGVDNMIGHVAFAHSGILELKLVGSCSIGNGGFYNCEGLTDIHIPGSTKLLTGENFAYCRNIKTVTLEEGISSLPN